jgi:TPR repeat protein
MIWNPNHRYRSLFYRLSLLTCGLLALVPGLASSKVAPAPQNYLCASVETLYRVRLNDAQLGDRDAQYALANMYLNGQGVARDYTKAFYWYKLAAFQRHAGAQFRLAVLYSNGKGVKQDLQMAYFWFSMAHNQGVESADGDLRYLRHVLTDHQLVQARQLFQQVVAVLGAPASD